MRCNQCRQELGLAHHYWGMPFCSTACMDGYKSRLNEETKAKIANLVVAKANAREAGNLFVLAQPQLKAFQK